MLKSPTIEQYRTDSPKVASYRAQKLQNNDGAHLAGKIIQREHSYTVDRRAQAELKLGRV